MFGASGLHCGSRPEFEDESLFAACTLLSIKQRAFSIEFQAGSTQTQREKRGMCKAANTEVKKQFPLPHPVPL